MSLLGKKILKSSVSMGGTGVLEMEGVIPLSNQTKSMLVYANKIFIEPFESKKYSLVEENYFNFDYIINNLTLSLPKQFPTDGANYKLINTYINIINSIQRAMDIRLSLTNAFSDAFSDKESNSVILETSRLYVSNVYFVYHYLIGIPPIHSKHDQTKLDIINTILANNAGITMENLRNNPDIINIIP
tara:strand:- start:315 stop:878 length:564 start_codon:yes stop_codon:yes gene_type:complete